MIIELPGLAHRLEGHLGDLLLYCLRKDGKFYHVNVELNFPKIDHGDTVMIPKEDEREFIEHILRSVSGFDYINAQGTKKLPRGKASWPKNAAIDDLLKITYEVLRIE